jgi:uncharacterized membrane protein YagU involved in acid resistance
MELLSTDEADRNVIVMIMLVLICSGLCGALVKHSNATEVQVPIKNRNKNKQTEHILRQMKIKYMHTITL